MAITLQCKSVYKVSCTKHVQTLNINNSQFRLRAQSFEPHSRKVRCSFFWGYQ